VSALQTVELCKAFGGRTIFTDISLQLDEGSALALMGASGSGKTTFLRCLNGLELADRGRVVVGGAQIDAADPPVAQRAAIRALRQHVGFVFQGSHLFSHRTVLQNVMEGPLYVQRKPAGVARERAELLLAKVGVAHRASAYPRELSGGEQQRAAIARALAMQPSILLLDEPTSALDAARGQALAELLRALIDEGVALLTVTHDASFAAALGARVLTLEAGQLRS
jgi:cystine transport system ATP-binding protein